jgi:glyoxylase-like metal-dependent hydrolase (beta-lactamase superfamily II)
MLTRRQTLFAAAAIPAAGLAAPLRAEAPLLGASAPVPFHRITLGAFEVTTLLAGTRTQDKPQETFGMNVSAEEFARVSAENRIPADRSQGFFTPTVVNTGAELVLFDTGLAPGAITAALAAAGYAPDQVDVVVLTHMHGDHIGGLMGEAGPTFPNARYVTGAVEHNFWSGEPSEGFTKAVVPLNDRMTFVDEGGAAVPGLTAMAAFGHSPGHMVWQVESQGQRLVIAADLANHPVWSLAYPAGRSVSTATRRRRPGRGARSWACWRRTGCR